MLTQPALGVEHRCPAICLHRARACTWTCLLTIFFLHGLLASSRIRNALADWTRGFSGSNTWRICSLALRGERRRWTAYLGIGFICGARYSYGAKMVGAQFIDWKIVYWCAFRMIGRNKWMGDTILILLWFNGGIAQLTDVESSYSKRAIPSLTSCLSLKRLVSTINYYGYVFEIYHFSDLYLWVPAYKQMSNNLYVQYNY